VTLFVLLGVIVSGFASTVQDTYRRGIPHPERGRFIGLIIAILGLSYTVLYLLLFSLVYDLLPPSLDIGWLVAFVGLLVILLGMLWQRRHARQT
jgi:hypothetical protein